MNQRSVRPILFIIQVLSLAWASLTPGGTAGVVFAQSTEFSLRFFGHGVGDIDRVKIPVDAPPVPADVAQDFTLEFWMRADAGDNGSAACVPGGDNWINGNIIVDRDVYNNGDYGDYGISLAGGRIAFGVAVGGSGETICGAASVDDSAWHHIAVTRDGSTGVMQVFVDGALDASDTGPAGDISYRDGRSTSYPDSDPYLVLGAEKHDAGPAYPSYDGYLDELRVSTIVRYTGSFTVPSAPFTADGSTAALYHFDEGPVGACTGTILDAASGGASGGECRYGGTAPAGPVYSSDTPFSAASPVPVAVTLGASSLGPYNVYANNTLRRNYTNLLDGPVSVVSLSADPVFSSQRVTSGDSYNELMGVPPGDFTTEYWFPWYDHGYPSVGGSSMRTWILVGNPDVTLSADVDIFIGGALQGSYTIPPGDNITPRWIGLQDGPVRVVSDIPVFASERVFTVPNNSFNEIMGYPADQFTTEYWFPWYDSVNMNASVMVGNTSPTTSADVDIYIGAALMDSYIIPADDTLIQSFPSTIDGPLRVVATNAVDIVASEAAMSGPTGSFTAYNEVMGYPFDQFDTEYWFPAYDHGYPGVSGSNMRTWILVGNPDEALTANVEVYIGGDLQGSYAVAPNSRVTPRWIGLQEGPVQVVSDLPVFTSQRVFTAPDNIFNEMMGYPASGLTDEYWFAWYDSVNMDTDILISRPDGGTGPAASLAGCPMFPPDNFWNARVDSLPVHARSAQWINSIGASDGFHMDFGSGLWDGGPIGIPYNVISASGVTHYNVDYDYDDESDPGPYPIPANPKREWGSDHHILLVDTEDCLLYEIYDASFAGGAWSGGSGAIWDLQSNDLRPAGWTSADAAGLQILPGLARYDEILAGEINHALRFTANNTNSYIWPARHLTSGSPGVLTNTPPMGARFRLKADYDISGFDPGLQVLLQAMKTYGIILADNGSDWYISGAPDPGWDDDLLHDLDVLTGSNFEAVDTSGLMLDPDSGATP